MRNIFRIAFLIFATLAGLALLWQFSLAFLLFLLSLVAASALHPAITALTARGISRRSSLAIVYGLLVLTIVGIFVLFTQPLLNDLQQFADDFVTGYERIKMEWPRGGTLFQRSLAAQLPPTEAFYSALSSEEGVDSMISVLGAARDVLGGLVQTAVILVLSMYWSADRSRFERLVFSLIPDPHHERTRRLWTLVESQVGGLVRGELVQSLIAGVILGISFWLMGVRYPALLAFWIAGARLLPWFGSILAILPPLVAIIAGAAIPGILISMVTLAVLLLLKTTVEPRFFDRKRYSALWIIITVIAMAELWGVVGALLASPLAIAAQLFAEALFPPPAVLHRPAILGRIEELRSRITDLDRRTRRNGRSVPWETRQALDRLRSRVDALTVRLNE